jgi:hypothetical protein
MSQATVQSQTSLAQFIPPFAGHSSTILKSQAIGSIITVSIFIVCNCVSAQRPNTGMWLTINTPVNISKKWQWHNDASYRTLGSSVAPLQYLYRTGIRYNFNDEWSSTLGVALFYTRNGFTKQNEEFGKEQRLWQELAYRKNITIPFQIYVRLRTEQRYFSTTTTSQAHHAFRYRVRVQLQQKFTQKFALQLANEYLQQRNGNLWQFDQNRSLINAVYFMNEQTNITVGYMYLLWPANSQQHILNINFQKMIQAHAKR